MKPVARRFCYGRWAGGSVYRVSRLPADSGSLSGGLFLSSEGNRFQAFSEVQYREQYHVRQLMSVSLGRGLLSEKLDCLYFIYSTVTCSRRTTS